MSFSESVWFNEAAYIDGGCRLSTNPFKSEAEELAKDVGLLSCNARKIHRLDTNCDGFYRKCKEIES